MFEIDEIKIEHSKKDVVTDNTQPVLSFSLRSDEDGYELCSGDCLRAVRKTGRVQNNKDQQALLSVHNPKRRIP